MNKIILCFLINLTFLFSCTSMDDEKIVALPNLSDTFLDFYYKYTGEEKPPTTTQNPGQWQILYSISKDDKAKLAQLLKNQIYKLESLDQKILGIDITMMHAAAYYNSINIIGWLVTKNADLTAKDQYSRTPHDIAILFNQNNAAVLIDKSIKLRKIQNRKSKCVIL